MDLNNNENDPIFQENYSNEADIDVDDQMLENLARMESRITVLEDKLEEIIASSDNSKTDHMLESYVIMDGEEYLCMKYMKKEPCILQKKVRRIGFDICIDDTSICPWAFKVND